jgi:hypothetical protein
LGLFLRTSIPFIWRILSACLRACTPQLRGPVSPRFTLITAHAALIDELDLSVGFEMDNVSNGLINLDLDGSAWAKGFREKPLDWLPHWVPELRAVLRPGTTIVATLNFRGNATAVANMAYENAPALAEQLVTLRAANSRGSRGSRRTPFAPPSGPPGPSQDPV